MSMLAAAPIPLTLSSASPGPIARGNGPLHTPQDHGAVGDGKASDHRAFVAADAAGGFVVPAGVYLIDSDTTLGSDFVILPGAALSIAPGKRLTVAGSMSAPIGSIFTGTGTVTFHGGRTAVAYPEWWGAKADDPRFDNLPALRACMASCPVMQLPAGDLHISATWVIDQDNLTVRGVKKPWLLPTGLGTFDYYTEGCSRIVLTGAAGRSQDVVFCGVPPAAAPSSLADFVKQPTLNDFGAFRDRPAICPAAGREADAPCGFRFMHTWHLEHKRLDSTGSPIGFYYGANVYCFMDENSCAITTHSDPSSAGDFGIGYYIDGAYRQGAFGVGANASLYFSRFKTYSPIGLTGRNIGLAAVFGWSDTWITEFETIGCKTGIFIHGSNELEASTAPNQNPRSMGQNQDFHILRATLDQPGEKGIEIGNLVRYASVEIIDTYVALGGGGAPKALHWFDSGGLTKVIGGHFYGWPNYNAGGSAIGIHAERGTGLKISDLSVIGFPRPAVLDTVGHVKLDIAVLNPYEHVDGPAVDCARVTDSRFLVDVQGGPLAATPFSAGVNFRGTSCDHNEVNGTGLRRPGMQALRYNGKAVTEPGRIAGTGNHYAGVPN